MTLIRRRLARLVSLAFVAGGVSLSSIFAVTSAFANPTCESVFAQPTTEVAQAEVSVRSLERTLNESYRQVFPLRERFKHKSLFRYRVFEPFRVSEGRVFFPDKRLPSLADMTEVRISRVGREEGIQEIRRGLLLSEERSWIFVPALQIWFYNSVNVATASSVQVNSALMQLLNRQYGEIEVYHTHPRLAADRHYEAQAKFFGPLKLSREQCRIATALPSEDDMTMIAYFLNEGGTRTKAVGFVVHELGVTRFQLQTFPYRDEQGRSDAVYPRMDKLEVSDVLVLSMDTPEKIRLMLRRMEEMSMTGVHCPDGVCRWTPETKPKLLLQYREF